MNKKSDILLGTLLLIVTLAFITLLMTNQSFFDWAFARHRNQWSWYLRPVFLIPFCYFAYKRSWTGINVTLFCLFTSMVWFPEPDVVADNVNEFLEYEKQYLYGNWDVYKILLTLTVPLSLFILGVAFWKRNLWLGIAVITLIATGKIVWSVYNAGDAGYSILVPAIIGFIVCIVFIIIGFRKLSGKNIK